MAREKARVAGWGRAILAGGGAGFVAGLIAVGTRAVMHAAEPRPIPIVWAAVISGIIGGILYGWLTRATHRPVAILWLLTLAAATVDGILIAWFPLASGPGPRTGLPLTGLVAPLRQLGALVGIGHFGTRHFNAASLPFDIVCHYEVAIVVAALVPWWSGTVAGADEPSRPR